ncbi:YggS family pyridoxal phosphate-dependent enzyme [Dongshaea marina]|uniref:YggS family pyridoxal phosphate-dependent enzyme n=1 Tax=Dongshaea marina TaxID=2047966 RepID=UPI000D3E70A9|nr:YggS family pyridoxal phosphate-dependent enzyme [Dongshaea marina]
MCEIKQCLQQVQARIDSAATTAGRPTHQIQLLAVSKTKPLAAVKAAIEAGQTRFGENYVQEGIEKIQALADDPQFTQKIEWYFIGPLQSNKTRPVAEHFDWVQSVDRYKIATRLSEQRPPTLAPLNICLQVNISGEPSKSGTSLEQLAELAAEVSQLPNLKLRGLMAIPENTQDQQQLAKQMEALHQAYLELQQQDPDIDTLSIGMSSDLELAINHGSTMVRIGTAIFGARNYSTKA